MPGEVTMQQKIKVITKLTESGYDTEKKTSKARDGEHSTN